MYYCENCNKVSEYDFCRDCGDGDLREVRGEDFCFLVECGTTFGEMLKSVFDKENIPCALLPRGTGVRTALALKLENYRVYVPYAFLERAKEILEIFL
ncbi:MAG: hypothetical protein IJU84_02725 [Clostridia bacterium]|nr:hypothetical protein [Clostridia bacterium]